MLSNTNKLSPNDYGQIPLITATTYCYKPNALHLLPLIFLFHVNEETGSEK